MIYVAIPEHGPALASEADALELVGQLYGQEVETLAIPVARMAPEFWDLRSRLAGLFIQKLTNYGIRPAFVGDLRAQIAASAALAAYVRECQRGNDVIFVDHLADLERRT